MALNVKAEALPAVVASDDAYITMSGIDWATFEGIAGRTRGGRVCYSDGDLEIMSPSLRHEDFGDRLGVFVDVFCEELGIEAMALGSTTWKSRAALKGVEADAAFYLEPGKVAAAETVLDDEGNDIDSARLPAPDLVIEIDIRRPGVERSGVYAAIGAVEVWEFDGKAVRIRRLGPEGGYTDIARSGWFPCGPADIVKAIVGSPRSLAARRRWMRVFVAELVDTRPR